MQVHTLYEGSYSVDASKKFVPFKTGIDDPKDRPASLFIHVQPFLIELGNELVLMDTGLGYHNEHGELVIHQNIRNAGFEPDDVSLVLMSHLHFDHSGGMINKQQNEVTVSFPQAEYVIQRGEWESAFTNTTSSYKTEIFEFLNRNAQLSFIEGSGQFTPEIGYELTGAHTQYHQVFLLDDGKDKVFFGGDVLPEPEELVKNFIAKYDLDGRLAMEQRKVFGERAAAAHWNCLFYHGKSQATGFVEQIGSGFKVV